MTDPLTVDRWVDSVENHNEDIIRGDIEVVQSPTCDGIDKNFVQVERRPWQLNNTVNGKCLDRFGTHSWAKLGKEIPRHGDRVKLRLIHSHKTFKTLSFYFDVDDQEDREIVLGEEAVAIVNRDWTHSDGTILVICKSKRDTAVKTSAATAASEIARVEKDLEDEQKQRQRARQANARHSTGSADSAHTTESSGSKTSPGSLSSST